MALSPEKKSLHCGDLASLCGVSSDTVRHYDRLGLLEGSVRSANGYRNFPLRTVRRIATIRAALAVGFSLEELARLLKERDSGGAPCAKVRRLAETKLTDIEERLRQMSALRSHLKSTLKEWDKMLGAQMPGKRAYLLENLRVPAPTIGRKRRKGPS
jgi:MerR family transcriptional regulator, copper efflux regulator